MKTEETNKRNILMTKKAGHYYVTENTDGTLLIETMEDRKPYEHAGFLINNLGGIDAVKNRLITQEEYDERIRQMAYEKSPERQAELRES